MVKTLLNLGCYTTESEIKVILPSLVKLLAYKPESANRTNIAGASLPEYMRSATNIMIIGAKNDFDELLILIKTHVCQIIDLIMDIRLKRRIKRLLESWKNERLVALKMYGHSKANKNEGRIRFTEEHVASW